MKSIQFQPERWHACNEADSQICENGMNCYSYILNRPDYFWSVPGDGFVKTSVKKYFKSFDLKYKDDSLDDFRSRLVRGAIEDGLISIETDIDRRGYYLAALFFAERQKDFHWYRKDDDGFWSHKNGREAASNRDDIGKRIKDPLSTKNMMYPIFGGLFLVRRNGIMLTKHFPLVSE